jgi:minor histocompatibility antigen H13
MSDNDGNNKNESNLLSSLMNQLNTQINNRENKLLIVVETDDQKQQRLRNERLAVIEAGEVRRTSRVVEDKNVYLFLFAMQFLPLIGNADRIESILYFFGMAVSTIYLGSRQEVIDRPEIITRNNALTAPIGASVAIGGLYLLLKSGIDISGVYAVLVSLFGALAISDIGVPILRATFPSIDFSSAEISIPNNTLVKNIIGLNKNEDQSTTTKLPLDGIITLGIGLLFTVIYWSPIPMEQKFIISNILAWALGMISLASISLGSYQTGAILLAGLFCYDIFWVFGTDVMMTVATSVEAPVKFLYTAPPPLDNIPRVYPFSVLGLGDVVIPGLFVRLMYTVDEILQPTRGSYFIVSTCAYAAGLYFALWQMISFIMDNQHCYTLIRLSLLVHLLVRR